MIRPREISNSDDIVDSRDVIARLRELEEWRDDAAERAKETRENIANALDDDIPDLESDLWMGSDGVEYFDNGEWDEDTLEELKTLQALAEEGADLCGRRWASGVGLIKDDYFETYVRELAEDLGDIRSANQWPATYIDWEGATAEAKMDYKGITWGDVVYWVRS